jgi:hypothetical protein
MNLLMSFHGVCKCAVEFSIWQTLKITKLGWIIAVFLLEFTHFTLFPDLRSKSVILSNMENNILIQMPTRNANLLENEKKLSW